MPPEPSKIVLHRSLEDGMRKQTQGEEVGKCCTWSVRAAMTARWSSPAVSVALVVQLIDFLLPSETLPVTPTLSASRVLPTAAGSRGTSVRCLADRRLGRHRATACPRPRRTRTASEPVPACYLFVVAPSHHQLPYLRAHATPKPFLALHHHRLLLAIRTKLASLRRRTC